MKEYNKYNTIKLDKKGQVATITIIPPIKWMTRPDMGTPGTELHWDLGEVFSELRGDNSVRVIVLTGSEGQFHVPVPSSFFLNQMDKVKKYLNEPSGSWLTFTGIIRTHQAMAEIEKPIVVKVNGDAIGFGPSLVFASDIIVAREDAKIIDIHLGMGETKEAGPEFGIVPGDGGCALMPLYMTPAKAKEYLMLAKPYTGKELAELGIINYAVPANQLDRVVDDIVSRLLKRSAYALAWAKRVANRRVVDHLNKTLDAGAAYEMVNFLQLERMGWRDKKTLD